MTIHPATACPMCGETPPPGRNLYCTARCRERAKKQRQRARAAGGEVPVPLAQRRRHVADELAEQLLSGRDRRDLAQHDELMEAQREVARLSAELTTQRREGTRGRRDAGRERLARQGAEREARFLALAFTRMVEAHSLTAKVPVAIRTRISTWIPEGENPWR
ncbi:hypothetical protein [Brachybacterium tyrofermentans]|uniref:hypothetical protein n=1 Tax=Brachybacterium tyrofermentans TaxID=47848 RepID=UPI003FD55D44